MHNAVAKLETKALLAKCYFGIKAEHPDAPAIIIWRYLHDGTGESFAEFRCRTTHGHDFECTGTAYGGDDPSYHGEGRCYCTHCGADGDA